jgi:hypothetical protein
MTGRNDALIHNSLQHTSAYRPKPHANQANLSRGVSTVSNIKVSSVPLSKFRDIYLKQTMSTLMPVIPSYECNLCIGYITPSPHLTREGSDPTCRNLPWFFFTARVHTTKSTVKILAANTYCKYFLKIVEVTHFFCTRNRLYQRFVQPS